MLWIIVLVVVISIMSSLATTTREERAAASARFARRWNIPLQLLIVGVLAFVFWPRG